MDLGIKGKAAVITGGSRGIGKATALEMAKEGCNIVISARTESDLFEAEKEIKALGVKALAVPADLEKAEGVNKLISRAFEVFGHVDILFNNAGHSHSTTPIDASDEEWESILNIHLMACVRTCRLVIPKMLERKWGRIINMSSMCGLAPMSGLADYNAAKAAVINYTRAIAMEYSKDGICATALCPGLIHTEIWDGFADNVGSQLGKTRQDILNSAADQASSTKRFARPEEVGKVVTFLASECASFVTGSSIPVDGGALAGIEIHF